MNSDDIEQRLAALEGALRGTVEAHTVCLDALLTCADPRTAPAAAQLLTLNARKARQLLAPPAERYFDSAIEVAQQCLRQAAAKGSAG